MFHGSLLKLSLWFQILIDSRILAGGCSLGWGSLCIKLQILQLPFLFWCCFGFGWVKNKFFISEYLWTSPFYSDQQIDFCKGSCKIMIWSTLKYCIQWNFQYRIILYSEEFERISFEISCVLVTKSFNTHIWHFSNSMVLRTMFRWHFLPLTAYLQKNFPFPFEWNGPVT